MDWLRVAEEWLGNYGWGARGQYLGISRMFADNDWPVIDMTRRSIEEAAAAIINLHAERKGAPE